MDNMFTVFIVQVVLWILLFIVIVYLVRKNTGLKKEIESLKEAWEKKKKGR